MYTGIVQTLGTVSEIQAKKGLTRYQVNLPSPHLKDLQPGASVSIDGICQTVVQIDGTGVWFEAMQETLDKTTLKQLKVKDFVNVERSAKIGDEIGGHVLSGHIFGTVRIVQILSPNQHNRVLTFQCPTDWMKYILPKGFIAINGASLTVVDPRADGTFDVHLIPETLARTTFSQKQKGQLVNIELDTQTLTLVNTLERILPQMLAKHI